MASLTPRGKTLRHLTEHRGITEFPANSNKDNRPNSSDGRWGILKAQRIIANGTWLDGTAWCGTWAGWALMRAGVKGVTYRIASVRLIQQDARNHAGPFLDWQSRENWRKVLRGDLVTFFDGAHVETVRAFKTIAGQVYVITDGGNTSSGNSGSQSNGGGSYRRVRPLYQADGFARVDYPGGAVRRRADRMLMAVDAVGVTLEVPQSPSYRTPWADKRLLEQLEGRTETDAVRLRAAIKGAS